MQCMHPYMWVVCWLIKLALLDHVSQCLWPRWLMFQEMETQNQRFSFNIFPWLFLYLSLFCVFWIGRCGRLNFRYSFFAFRYKFMNLELVFFFKLKKCETPIIISQNVLGWLVKWPVRYLNLWFLHFCSDQHNKNLKKLKSKGANVGMLSFVFCLIQMLKIIRYNLLISFDGRKSTLIP